MPAKKYKVLLTKEERTHMLELVSSGKAPARKIVPAHILLKADQGEGRSAWQDPAISEAFTVSVATVERVRQVFVEEGLERALNHKRPSRSRPKKFDGEKEAHLVALACSAPPLGRKSWTLKLLADKLVELEHFESVSYETVRRVLKKRA